jgi:tetratricopeptide (TPR) repeat protein
MRFLHPTISRAGSFSARIAALLLAATIFVAWCPTQGQPQSPVDSASLQGTVRDSSGRPVAGATVRLELKDGAQTLLAHADQTGSYRFAGLSEGLYLLRAEVAGYAQTVSLSCAVGPNQQKKVDLILEPLKTSPAQASPATKTGAEAPQFFDEPQFTVAGVTDTSNLGGHGSNTVVRAKESLAKDVASLTVSGDKPSTGGAPAASSARADPAEASLRMTAAREPENFEANHSLGKFLIEHGKAAEALACLERASQLRPGDYENSYLLSLAYVDTGQYQHARMNVLALLAEQGNGRQPLVQSQQADLHHVLGDIEEKLADPLAALHEYQTAAELNPTEGNVFDWGAELLQHRAAEPAIEVFNKGNRLFPHSARMLVALGVAWYSNGSYDQAAQRLCEASDLNPADPQPYLFLGKIQSVETDQSECSGERLKRFVELHPENAWAHYYYGVNLWKRRKGPDDAEIVAQAESHLARAVQLDPTLGIGYLQLGVLYSERKDFFKAISSYLAAIQVNPQLEEAHYRLAQAYKRTGEMEKSRAELRLYNQISKSKDEEVERERRESRQFVYTLRGTSVGAQSR